MRSAVRRVAPRLGCSQFIRQVRDDLRPSSDEPLRSGLAFRVISTLQGLDLAVDALGDGTCREDR